MKTEPIYIVGPTAVGKTEISIALAKKLDGEIVSADSMQVYRGMDIGTAKPSPEQMAQVPHHLIGILDLQESFSVAEFRKLAEEKIQEIRNRGHVPLITGGTGLYVKALTEGIFEGPSANWELRKSLRTKEKEFGPGYLYEELRRVDPESAKRIASNDLRRIVRALEVYETTGKTITENQREWETKRPGVTIIGIDMERKALNERINTRVDEMFEAGLVKETEGLLGKGIENNRTAMQAIGYKEVIGHLRGEYSLDRAKELLKRDSRRYAKRQLTWFRKDDRIRWYEIVSKGSIDTVASQILEYLKTQGYDARQGG